uniref:Meis_PKNOX_N domain-containing protein n=1 Tax=Gongylonema pulchrum TaxID=637853 RepID=A0A183DN04_9BILA
LGIVKCVYELQYGDGYGPPPTASDVYAGAGTDPAAAASLGYFSMGAYPPVGSAPPTMLTDPLNEQMKRDKEAIYNHPLFPLLSCLFEKCELATCTPRDQNNRDSAATSTSSASSANDVCSSASFKDDLADFAKMVSLGMADAKRKTVLCAEPRSRHIGMLCLFFVSYTTYSTMLQSIQVLRFHLLELEKVGCHFPE